MMADPVYNYFAFLGRGGGGGGGELFVLLLVWFEFHNSFSVVFKNFNSLLLALCMFAF